MTSLRTAIAFRAAAVVFATAASATTASAQYVPFGQTAPTGFAARTFATANPSLRSAVQAVRWEVPGEPTVTAYSGTNANASVFPSSEPVGLQTGHVHRFKLSGFAEEPTLELYPSVELIDRLHPPQGEDAKFPVVLELTERDLADAVAGVMVTKVIYVQPRNALYLDPVLTKLPTTRIPLDTNVMAEAVLRGRPIAIVRIGTRAPMVGESRGFFGSGGRVVWPVPSQGFLNPDARVACDPGCPTAKPITNARRYPDEYICDGGDTGVPTTGPIVVADEIGFEETIGAFIDDDGDVQTRPSTRVCVYAPSFGAVTVGSGGRMDTLVLKPAGAAAESTSSDVATNLPPVLQDAQLARETMRVRSRLSGLLAERTDAEESVSLKPSLESKVVGSFEEFGFLSPLLTDHTARLIIGERLAASIEWSENRPPIIMAIDETLSEVFGSEVGAEYVTFEDRRPPGELIIAKTADRRSANLGETVAFAIRFENTGGKPLREVTITDHLSPRLAYVPDSLTSSLDAETDVADDGFGSVLITVRLDEPLEGGEGGTITFETIVR